MNVIFNPPNGGRKELHNLPVREPVLVVGGPESAGSEQTVSSPVDQKLGEFGVAVEAKHARAGRR